MSDELEVIPPGEKPPRFNLKNAKTPAYMEVVQDIQERTGLEKWQIDGVIGDLANVNKTREAIGEIAKRWGVGIGDINTCRHMGKVTIDDAREMMVTKGTVISNKLLDGIMEDVSNPEKMADIKPRDKVSMWKSVSDGVINLENKFVGAPSITNQTVGDVQVLIQMREAREKSGGNNSLERLLAKGLDPKYAKKLKG
jgi:hypothetical protein